MQFLQQNDLLNAIDSATLNIVTDGNNALLDSAELQAIEYMKAYLNVRYDTDKVFDATLPRNASIVLYLTDIMLYYLHARISPDNIPELRTERYREAKDWCEKVADGFIAPNLPVKDVVNSTPLRYGSQPKQSNFF